MKRFLSFFALVNAFVSIAQPLTVEENQRAHRRYWFFRTRFVNDFVNIGKEQGDCIAFAERNHSGWPVNTPQQWGNDAIYASKIGPDQIDIMNQYLSALALEYKLLSRNNQSTNKTIKRISA